METGAGRRFGHRLRASRRPLTLAFLFAAPLHVPSASVSYTARGRWNYKITPMAGDGLSGFARTFQSYPVVNCHARGPSARAPAHLAQGERLVHHEAR